MTRHGPPALGIALAVLLTTTVASAPAPGLEREVLLDLAGNERVLDVRTSPDLAHWVAVTTLDGAVLAPGSKPGPRRVTHDGALVGSFQRVPSEHIVFSPDGSRCAFVSVSWGKDDFGKYRVHVDGEPVGDPGHYSGVMEMGAGLGPWFSPDGSRLAWPWLWKGVYSVMVDGKSPKSQVLAGLRMDHPWTPDGRLVAVSVSGDQESLLVDGKVTATARGIRPVVQRSEASTTAHALAWVQSDGQVERLMLDGEPGPPFASVGDPAVSPDGLAWAYAALDGQGRAHAILDGTSVGEHDQVSRPGFGPGAVLAYLARDEGRTRLVVGGVPSPDFGRIDDYAFVPGTPRVILVGRDGARRHVIEGDPQSGSWVEVGSYQQVHRIATSPSGRVALSVEEKGRAAVYVDGARVGPALDAVVHCSVAFSDDGQHLAFAGRVGSGYVMVVDGEVLGTWERIVCPVVVTPDAVRFVAWSADAHERVSVAP